MLLRLRLLLASLGGGVLLLLLLCLGAQNLHQRASLNLGFGRTAELPTGFLVGVALVIGVISAMSYQPHSFNPHDVALLTAMADQVGVAIDNAQLFEATNQRVAELTALQRRFPDRVSRVSVIGLMGGIAWKRPDGGPDTGLSVGLMQEALRRGVILLPEGEHSEVTGITPPLTITEAQLRRAFREITRSVEIRLGGTKPPAKPRHLRSRKSRP